MLTNSQLDSASPLAVLLIGQPQLRASMRLGVLAALLLRCLEDPLPQPPYLALTGPPVDGIPSDGVLIPGLVLRSVHLIKGRHCERERVSCHWCLTCPSVPAVTGRSSSTAHLPTSARFRGRAPGPRSGQLYEAAGGGAGHAATFSRCLSAAGIRFLGILSRPGLPPPLRSAYRAASQRRGPGQVGSGQGAVPVFRPARFPGPPSAPGVPITRHRALHMPR
jgi:hypothetical protein